MARSQVLALVAVVVATCLVLSSAYPSGAPKCSSLVPKHAKNKAQTSSAPYKVTTSAVTKDKDGKSTLTVTVAGLNDAKFKGFMVYATPVDSTDKIGKFTKTDKTSLLSCGSAVSLTPGTFLASKLQPPSIFFISLERDYPFE